MPAAIPLILQIGATALTAGLGTVASALIVGGATLAGAYLASALFGNKQKAGATDIRANFVTTDRPIPSIYGRQLVGSNDVFAEAGKNGEGPSNRKCLWVVHSLGEGVIYGLGQIEHDGEMKDEIYIDGKLIWEYKGVARAPEPGEPPEPSSGSTIKYWVRYGTPDQEIVTELRDGTRLKEPDKFTDPMRNTAYIVFRFRYGNKKDKMFAGVPTREVVVKGIKCYDPRWDATIWTDNPVWFLYNYMTNPRYGLGWDSSKFDISSFEEAATYCEFGAAPLVNGFFSTGAAFDIFILSDPLDYSNADVSSYIVTGSTVHIVVEKLTNDSLLVYPASQWPFVDEEFILTQPKWTMDYVVTSQMKAQDIIDTILSHFRGAFFWYDGKVYLKYFDVESLVAPFEIKDEHIARDSDGLAALSVTQPSKFNIPDGVVVNFVNADDNWVADRINIGDPNRTGNVKQLEYVGFTNRNMASDMGTYELEREQLSRAISFSLRPDTIVLDTNDVISITSSELKITDQLARVKSNAIGPSGLISVMAILEREELYDRTYHRHIASTYNVNFPGISEPPPGVSNINVTEDTYDFRGRSFVRLDVTFDTPAGYPWFSHVDVYVYSGVAPPENDGVYLFQRSAAGDFQIDPVGEWKPTQYSGQTNLYYVRLNTVSIHGIKQDDVEAPRISHKVIGVSNILPQDPTYLNITVNLASVDIISIELDDPDIDGYEVRLGDDWLGSVFLTFSSNPSVTFGGVKPSLPTVPHKFWLNTKNKTGNYSETPLSADAIIDDPPPGSHVFFTEVIDYASVEGVNHNIEVTGSAYPNQWIQCAHTPVEDLHGDYISNEINISNLSDDGRVVVYVLFEFVLSSGLNSWDELAPDPNNWEDLAKDGVLWRSWDYILGAADSAVASLIAVSIEYSETPNPGPYDPDNYEKIERLELLYGIIKGKYVRVRFKIQDINSESRMTIKSATLHAAYLEDNLLIDA